MFSVKFGKCRICLNPFPAIAEVGTVFCVLHVVPFVSTLGLCLGDYLAISFLVVTGILGSLFLHEYAHVLAARSLRVLIKGITVSAFGAYTTLDDQPSTPGKAFVISFAGPLMNILIGSISYACFDVFRQTHIAATAFLCLAFFNGIFSVYNLLPVIPLDGGYIVRSAFWGASRDWGWSTRISFNIGTGFIMICVVTGIIGIFTGNAFLGVFSIVVAVSLGQSERLAYQQISTARFWGMLNSRSR